MDALEGLAVLDLASHIAGPYSTKLLADLGARVIKFEKPGGDYARGLGPFLGDQTGIERSGTYQFLNTNKESVVLDLTQDSGQEAVYRLAARCHMVVVGFPPRQSQRLGVDYQQLTERT